MMNHMQENLNDNQQQEEVQADHGVPFINTSVSKTEDIKSPQEEGEESNIGSMTNPEADDDVREFGEPFDEE